MHSNYSDAHTNVKAQLEADGYTVTLQTSGVVPDNLINNYDVVFDLKYNNNIILTVMEMVLLMLMIYGQTLEKHIIQINLILRKQLIQTILIQR